MASSHREHPPDKTKGTRWRIERDWRMRLASSPRPKAEKVPGSGLASTNTLLLSFCSLGA